MSATFGIVPAGRVEKPCSGEPPAPARGTPGASIVTMSRSTPAGRSSCMSRSPLCPRRWAVPADGKPLLRTVCIPVMRFRLMGRPGLAGHGELDAALLFNIADQADVRRQQPQQAFARARPDQAGRPGRAGPITEQSDVVPTNALPEASARLGIGYAAVAARTPATSRISILGFGRRPPFGGRRVVDAAAQALSGQALAGTVAAMRRAPGPVTLQAGSV